MKQNKDGLYHQLKNGKPENIKKITRELDKVAYDWEQMTDNASAVGEITIQECLEDSKDEE